VQSVREKLFSTLKLVSQGRLDLLVLLGDVIDLTVGRAPEPWVIAREFLAELVEQVPFERLVYIPGNHDHHVWVLLAEYEELLKKIDSLKRPLVGQNDPSLELGTIYPYHTPMHELFPKVAQKCVWFAYPFYTFPPGNLGNYKCRFVFHHGHYFDRKITPLARFASKRYGDLAKVEAFNLPYIESLFYFCSWDATLQSVELGFYDKLTRVGIIAKKSVSWLPYVRKSRTELGTCDVRKIDDMMTWTGFRSMNLCETDVWVFGHTHKCDDYGLDVAPKAMRMFNVGGWVLNHDPKHDEETAWSRPAIFWSDGMDNHSIKEVSLNDEEKEKVYAKMAKLGKNKDWLKRLNDVVSGSR
jgi:UDP-2,3-diacylglucosamine pyrophosphatase LpxH